MTRHVQLPQLAGGMFLTDSGMETTLVFHEGMELPHFASFTLLNSEDGRKWVRGYYERHLQLAQDARAGFVLDTPTWRANADWGAKLGLTPEELAAVNAGAVAMMKELRTLYAARVSPIVISGNIGPRGDGYVPGEMMSADEAEAYHRPQIETFATAGVDMVSALTLSYAAEAIGVVRASVQAGVASIISFTLETDGSLPSGQSLEDAIEETDAATGGGAAYYMINCAHPDHFGSVFTGAAWEQRIRGVRANASRRSHAELNEATELDAGNPEELAAQYAALLVRMPQVNVLGGCCGTDHRHVAAIGHACCMARNKQQKES
ncbi:MAG: homocysteine S-methyltransferase family protein [Hyphomicrobium sp.]|nr:homocysteine S-methyltransferase family protein [Hyphomicrobium sp.]